MSNVKRLSLICIVIALQMLISGCGQSQSEIEQLQAEVQELKDKIEAAQYKIYSAKDEIQAAKLALSEIQAKTSRRNILGRRRLRSVAATTT